MLNFILAGIGGQGINSLARILAFLCKEAGMSCQYTVHKGGAQSLGSVYAEMRVCQGVLPTLGPAIPNGGLNAMVAMDPWEALRHLNKVNKTSKTWVETESMPLFTSRATNRAMNRDTCDTQTPYLQGPMDQLRALPISLQYRTYRRQAIEHFAEAKMANYFAGLDCLEALGLLDIPRFKQLFQAEIPAAMPQTRRVLS